MPSFEIFYGRTACQHCKHNNAQNERKRFPQGNSFVDFLHQKQQSHLEECPLFSQKKYCPIWVYDCVVSQSVSDFILNGIDLTQPCKKFYSGLIDTFEEVSLEELPGHLR